MLEIGIKAPNFSLLYENENIHSLKDNKANVVGKTITLASPFGMHKSCWRLRQDLELEKIDGKWIIKHSKASTY